MCYNCNQRGTGICEFDSVPKRRGPDRQPGARQRHGKVPGPRVRRRSKNDKQEDPSAPQTSPYLTLHAENKYTNVPTSIAEAQNATWARIPSPPSTTSTDGFSYGYEQPAPSSSGSDMSQVQHEYHNMPSHPFAYSAPQDGYVDRAIRPESHPPNSQEPLLHVSADSLAHISADPLSTPFSPGTSTHNPHPIFSNPFGSQTSNNSNAPSCFMTGATNANANNMTTMDSTASPVSVGYGESAPCDLTIGQSTAGAQEQVAPISFANFDVPATERRGNSDYLAALDTCSADARRDSFTSVVCHLPALISKSHFMYTDYC